MLELYDYQQDAVDDIRREYSDGCGSLLYVLPTGGGKTVIFSKIAELTAMKNKRVWILVHRVELLRQTSAALKRWSVHHGLVNPNYTPDPFAGVQVASVQTMVNRFRNMPAPDLIIIDEAHHATAGSWKKIIKSFPKARVLGVTATPVRGDGKGLGVDFGGVFEELIVGPQIADLIARGFLVQPIIYGTSKPVDLSSVKIVRGEYDRGNLEKILDKPMIRGNAVKHYQKICPGVPAVVFCVSIDHAEHMAREFRSAGFRAHSVDALMDDDDRHRILNGLGDGSVQVVTSCDLISEGTDIPAIECAILMRPTNSLAVYLQQVGRALRRSDGKSSAIILDHVGNVRAHGFPDDFREWTLAGKIHGQPAKRNYRNGESVRMDNCPQCDSYYQANYACPECGYVKESPKRSFIEIEDELEIMT